MQNDESAHDKKPRFRRSSISYRRRVNHGDVVTHGAHLMGAPNEWLTAVAALSRGELVVLVDERTGAGDLVAAAEGVSAAVINTMAARARGLTELALPAARVAALALPPMGWWWDSPRKPYTVSIEATSGVTTGISAADRAATIRAAVSASARPADLASPGHVFPLRVPPGGLGARRGRSEAALALAAAAGSAEGAVLCHVLDDAGDLAGVPALHALAEHLNVPVIGIDVVCRATSRGPRGRRGAAPVDRTHAS